jgi:hypothetical protein
VHVRLGLFILITPPTAYAGRRGLLPWFLPRDDPSCNGLVTGQGIGIANTSRVVAWPSGIELETARRHTERL